jgi:hypothetical protein
VVPDASLGDRLMTGDARQWSGVSFVRRYQRDVGNVFRPSTLATGADVCFLRDGLVAENWTIPSRWAAPCCPTRAGFRPGE